MWVQWMGKGRNGLDKRGDAEETEEEFLVFLSELMLEVEREEALEQVA
jgi:hypothetical protein